MTQEEKQILIKDLCGRLPYGIKVWYPNGNGAISTVKGIVGDICYFNENPIYDNFCHIETVKPYLRPLSSITEEEENEWRGFNIDPLLEAVGKPHTRIEDLMLSAKSQYDPLDWLNEHHFDYRGLIEKGLALEAPDGMYKTE